MKIYSHMEKGLRLMLLGLVVSALVIATGCSTFHKKAKAVEPPAPVAAAPAPETPADAPKETPAGTPTEFDAAANIQNVYFDFDKSTIRADQVAKLDSNLKYFLANQGFKVVVEGNTDERGTVEYNFALGNRRAEAVKAYLVKGGLPADRVVSVSKGEEQPAVVGHDEKAWSQNRRAHFMQLK